MDIDIFMLQAIGSIYLIEIGDNKGSSFVLGGFIKIGKKKLRYEITEGYLKIWDGKREIELEENEITAMKLIFIPIMESFHKKVKNFIDICSVTEGENSMNGIYLYNIMITMEKEFFKILSSKKFGCF